jgi:hypothetical protein
MISDPDFTRLGPRPPPADRSAPGGKKLQNIVANMMNVVIDNQ